MIFCFVLAFVEKISAVVSVAVTLIVVVVIVSLSSLCIDAMAPMFST